MASLYTSSTCEISYSLVSPSGFITYSHTEPPGKEGKAEVKAHLSQEQILSKGLSHLSCGQEGAGMGAAL